MTCYVIAEAGVAHEGSLDTAHTLLSTAVAAGADAFKVQYFGKGMKRRDGTELPWLSPMHMEELSSSCRGAGLDFIVTPHDTWAVHGLKDLLCTKVKIGSGDWHLLPAVLGRFTRKEIIISTGMHTEDEIDSMLNEHPDISVLHCISAYPTLPENSKLWYMHHLLIMYSDHTIGYSDHTVGTAIPLAAVGMGAEIIEKHITLERNIPGKADTFVSLNHEEFIKFVADIRDVDESITEPSYRRISLEEQQTKEWVMKSRGLTLDTWR